MCLNLKSYTRVTPFLTRNRDEWNGIKKEPEDIQNIEAHLLGDIPNVDIEALQDYWAVYPNLENHLFGKSKRPHFSSLNVAKDAIKQSIFSHPEIIAYTETVNVETYEDRAKAMFLKEPANMKLLIVVAKLLTGFDAPSCTYIYLDKTLQDHVKSLFTSAKH